jgi:hypothetical protein
MVRAIEAKYYGRTARTYQIGDSAGTGVDLAPAHFLTEAAAEFATVATQDDPAWFSTLRHVRIPERRAAQWARRLNELVEEFTAEERAGETTYGLLVAMYPTDRPHLPDREGE